MVRLTPTSLFWKIPVELIRVCRRQHRKIAGMALTPKAMQGYASVMDYEAHMLIKSLYEESLKGKRAINTTHYTGRFALK